MSSQYLFSQFYCDEVSFLLDGCLFTVNLIVSGLVRIQFVLGLRL